MNISFVTSFGGGHCIQMSFTTCQPMDGSGCDASLPSEGKHAAANLFAMIVESELKGNHNILLTLLLHYSALVIQHSALLPVNVIFFLFG